MAHATNLTPNALELPAGSRRHWAARINAALVPLVEIPAAVIVVAEIVVLLAGILARYVFQIRAMVGRLEPLSSCMAPAPPGCVFYPSLRSPDPYLGPGVNDATQAQAAAEDGTGAGMSASSISRARTAAGRLANPS